MRLVMTGRIVPAAAREPLLGKPQRRLGEIENAALPDAGLEAELRRLVAQRLALLRGPVLDQIPSRIERSLIIEEPDPESRTGRQAPPWSAVSAAHLEIALETHLRKDGRDVIG